MPFTSQAVAYSKPFMGVVVRPPSSSSSAAQALAFFSDEARELLEVSASGTTGAGKTFRLSVQPLAVSGKLRSAHCPVYDPTSDCVFFIDTLTSIKRLDRSNAISRVAGREGEEGNVDGPGEAARFMCVRSLAADGKGNVFIADYSVGIRVLDILTGGVRTLWGSAPVCHGWTSISYDSATDMLVAATRYAVCYIPLTNQQGSNGGGASAARPRLIAGSWSDGDFMDGSGTAARFDWALSVLPCAGGTILIGDNGKLRSMDASGAVTTLLVDPTPGFYGTVAQMAFLPGGEVVCTDYRSEKLVIIISPFAPSSEALAGRIPTTHGSLAPPDLLDFLLTPLGAEGGNTSVAIVTINTGGDGAGSGGGKSFTAHRSVLAAHSEYFKTRLAADSGFVDSGAAKVSLPDAHPEAFGRLLVYMYGNALVVPGELLRPAAELARRLLMPADCIAQLHARMMAAVTPESVVSDLVWAAQYGMEELVPQLQAYLVRHRKEVVAAAGVREGLSALVATDPDLTTELMLMLL